MRRILDADENFVRRPLGFRTQDYVPEPDDPTGAVSGTTVHPERVPPERDDMTPPWAGKR